MRLWLSRTTAVGLREQLVTQVRLGILTRELKPGEKLPSTRELARRFGVHANTVSAAYRELEEAGWVEQRHGSGVFVRPGRPERAATKEAAVDALIGELAVKARRAGADETLVRERLRRWLEAEPPARWLVVEPDAELRRIVVCELRAAVALPVDGCAPEEMAAQPAGALAAVLPSKAERVRALLPAGLDLTVLAVQPVTSALAASVTRYLPEHAADLVGVASRWSEFRWLAQTMLAAAGFGPEGLLVRDAAQAGWKRGLGACAAVVCDAATEAELPREARAIVFRLLPETTLAGLRERERRFEG